MTDVPIDLSKCNCRVCGFREDFAPWGDDGLSPDFSFCPCCGAEHGYQDATLTAARANRRRWIDGGAKWFKDKYRPADWSLALQLEGIPEEYR
jgi:hypothetical protein